VFYPANKTAIGQGDDTMRIAINEIKVGPGRREAQPEAVRELADSISEVGLLNPITVNQENTLIAGLHRLEAAKLLGWKEIECTVSQLDSLQAKLAEIDENFVRVELGSVDYGDLLLQRKEIYEKLHPETRVGISQAAGMNRAVGNNVSAPGALTSKPFVVDTAEKFGVSKRTVEENLQIAKDLTPNAKKIIQNSGKKVKKKEMLKLARLPSERQEEAARQLTTGAIHSVDDHQPPPVQPVPQGEETGPEPECDPPPYDLGGTPYTTFEESIADLKNHDKDCSYTADTLLADMDGFIDRFHQDFTWYANPFCTAVFPRVSRIQFEYIKKRLATIPSAVEDLLHQMERKIQT